MIADTTIKRPVMIAICPEIEYNNKCLDRCSQGVLLLERRNKTQYALWAKRPLSGGFTSCRLSKQLAATW